MNNTLDDRYVRVDDYASRVKGLEFGSQVWAVFAQLAEPRAASEIASALKLAPEAVDGAFKRLLNSKLIRKEVALGWNEFSASAAAPVAGAAKPAPPVTAASSKTPAAPVPSSSSGAAAKPSGKAPAGKPSAPASAAVRASAPVSAPAPVAAPASPAAPAVVFLRLGSERALKPSAPLVNLRLSRASASTETCAPWKLRPILDAIGARAGGGVPGQLLVYKVFLQLPPDLLKEAGLHSLSVVDDHFTVNLVSLRSALVDAARRHADIDITPMLAA